MTKYNIVRLPDDAPYRYWKLYPDTIVIPYGEALEGRPDVAPNEDLPSYKPGLMGLKVIRVQVGLSCINYPEA